MGDKEVIVEEFEEGSSSGNSLDSDNDEDADAPRVVQWVGEDEMQFDEVDNDVVDDRGPLNLVSLLFELQPPQSNFL